MRAFLSEVVKTIVVMNPVAAGTSNQTSSAVDLSASGPADSLRFVASLGALTSTQVTKLKVQYSDDNVTYADVTGSETPQAADADSNKLLVVDIIKPTHRYYKAIVERGTANAVINVVIAEVYCEKALPVTQDATVSQIVELVSP